MANMQDQVSKAPNPLAELRRQQLEELSTAKNIVKTNPEAILPAAFPAKSDTDILTGLKNSRYDVLSSLKLGQLGENLSSTQQKANNALTGLALGSALVAGAVAVLKELNSPEAIARREAAAEKKEQEQEKKETLAKQDKQRLEQEALKNEQLREIQKKVNIATAPGAEQMMRNQTKGGALTQGALASTETQQRMENAIGISAENVREMLEKQRGSLEDPEKQKQEGKLELA